ncbi:unnamed protein product [Urochloa humidicola]
MEQLRQLGEAVGSINALMAFEPEFRINPRQCRLLADAWAQALATVTGEVRAQLRFEERSGAPSRPLPANSTAPSATPRATSATASAPAATEAGGGAPRRWRTAPTSTPSSGASPSRPPPRSPAPTPTRSSSGAAVVAKAVGSSRPGGGGSMRRPWRAESIRGGNVVDGFERTRRGRRGGGRGRFT